MTSIEIRLTDLERRVALLEAASPTKPPAPRTGPRTMLGTSFAAYWSHEDAFINHALVAGRDYDSHVNAGMLSADGTTYVSLPAGAAHIGLVRDGTPAAPDHYAGKWVLDWEGDGKVALTAGGKGDLVEVGANRIEETFDPARHGHKPPRVSVVSVGAAGVKNIRYYRAEHEAALNAGEIFDPLWKGRTKRFDGLRPMDWMNVNASLERTAADRPRADRPFWFRAVPDAVIVRAAVDTETFLWLNVPGLIGFTQTAYDAVHAGKGLTQEEKLTIIKGEGEAILDATPEALLEWAREIVRLMDGAGYPLDRELFIELSNEDWNFSLTKTVIGDWGLGQYLNSQFPDLRDNMRTGFGWRSALMQAAFRLALDEAGRRAQKLTTVLAAHTAMPSRTEDAFKAAQTAGIDFENAGVATTHYYSGGFKWHRDNTLFGEKLAEADWIAKWRALLAADRQELFNLITDYMLASEPKFANVAWLMDAARQHKAIAESFGARWVGTYEGDSHETIKDTRSTDPEVIDLHREWHESDAHGSVVRAVAEGIFAISPDAIMANYGYLAGGRSVGQPWMEGAAWDDTGGDNEAWNEILKPEGDGL